jgi:hypothetical protein
MGMLTGPEHLQSSLYLRAQSGKGKNRKYNLRNKEAKGRNLK